MCGTGTAPALAYRGAELIEGFVERQIDIAGRGARSQSDIMAFIKAEAGYAVVAVEGKAEERFADPIKVWDDGTPNDQPPLSGPGGILV
jgi:hypothetical protein